MKNKKNDIEKNEPPSQNKSNLFIYISVLLLLLSSRMFDILTTYLVTPDLSGESNFLVRYFGFGWTNLYLVNMGIIAVFFLIFTFSWSELSKSRDNEHFGFQTPLGGFITRNGYSVFHELDYIYRNIGYEIGLTLPVYVIITGYFQGAINIMVYYGVIVVSFTHSQFLYPVMIGGVFGIISHYFAKRLLYEKYKPLSKRPHKIMVSNKP